MIQPKSYLAGSLLMLALTAGACSRSGPASDQPQGGRGGGRSDAPVPVTVANVTETEVPLEVVTVGTMPEDRVWLDNTGRPISDQARITERFRRLDNDTMEWSETIDDPKIYTRPWETLKLRMTLQDPRIDLMTRYCSPVEIDNYNKSFGDAAGAN